MTFRKNPPKKHFSNGTEVLLNLFHGSSSPISEQFLKWRLWSQWKQIVGPTISAQTEPLRIYNGKLIIWVKNSTWLQQLNFMKEPILENIDRKFKANFIKEVHFTLYRGDMESIPKEEVLENVNRIEQWKGKK